jgi:hypothetical protein
LGWAALLRGNHAQAEALHEESLRLSQELGNKIIVSESLEGLACAAEIRGEAEWAARLFGAAEALRETLGIFHLPSELALREPYVSAAHSRLDEAAWKAAWEEGRAMTLDEAIAYALEEDVDG